MPSSKETLAANAPATAMNSAATNAPAAAMNSAATNAPAAAMNAAATNAPAAAMNATTTNAPAAAMNAAGTTTNAQQASSDRAQALIANAFAQIEREIERMQNERMRNRASAILGELGTNLLLLYDNDNIELPSLLSEGTEGQPPPAAE